MAALACPDAVPVGSAAIGLSGVVLDGDVVVAAKGRENPYGATVDYGFLVDRMSSSSGIAHPAVELSPIVERRHGWQP